MKILMVCLGNICRSPIAEGVLQHLANEQHLNWTVESAGTNQFHIGEEPHKSSQKVCKENGIDISHQRARRFKTEDFIEYDLIFALATDVIDEMKTITEVHFNATKVQLLLDVIYPGENKSVTDPWYGTEAGYYPVFDEIKKCCEAIVTKYK
jgi:protein-tyrosine phosphatase